MHKNEHFFTRCQRQLFHHHLAKYLGGSNPSRLVFGVLDDDVIDLGVRDRCIRAADDFGDLAQFQSHWLQAFALPAGFKQLLPSDVFTQVNGVEAPNFDTV